MKCDPQSETSNSQQLLGCQVTDRSEDGPRASCVFVCVCVCMCRWLHTHTRWHACMSFCLCLLERSVILFCVRDMFFYERCLILSWSFIPTMPFSFVCAHMHVFLCAQPVNPTCVCVTMIYPCHHHIAYVCSQTEANC